MFQKSILLLLCASLMFASCTQTATQENLESAMQVQSSQQDALVVSEPMHATEDQSMEKTDASADADSTEDMMVMEKDSMQDNAMQQDATNTYVGMQLGGTHAPLLDFAKDDYDKAVSEGKIIFLYFYAEWCPVCVREFPEAKAAFDELLRDDIIGFRVNYKDSHTDADEQALAKQFGITYQHTKVVVADGKSLVKDLASWDKAKYLNVLTTIGSK